MSAAHWPPGLVDLSMPTRIVAGRGALVRLGELVAPHARRVVLVTDAGLVATGIPAAARESLVTSGVEVRLFDQVQSNPTETDVEACRLDGVTWGADAWVGLGGGSALDTAKAAALLATNGGRMRDYWGWKKGTRAAQPVFAVPTTAGTGSETQSYTLVSRDEDHRKLACGDPSLAPRVALLDPYLTVSSPREVTVSSALDTLVHALETAVTTKRNHASAAWTNRCAHLVFAALPPVLSDPNDLDAREWLQWASALGGLAIESSMLGAAHAAANPLTARLGVTHGRAVAFLAPAVMRFNANDPKAAEGYFELARVLGFASVAQLIDRTVSLIHRADPSLREELATLAAPHVDALAVDAADQWTGRFNPRPVDASAFTALYRDAIRG